MTICAVIWGCDVWEDIVDYCRVKEAWFRESLHMELKNGVPSHDTIQRVWGMIEPKEFEKRFCAWVEAVCQKTKGEIISIDGRKKSGGSDQKPIHMVSAWANSRQMVLGQLATSEKPNEITAVPELLEMLDVAGCIITADAIAVKKRFLGLKDNHLAFRREVQEYFDAAGREARNYSAVQCVKTLDSGHGRIESRIYYLTTEIDWYEGKAEWRGLRSFGMVRSKVEQKGVVTEDVRYFISSLEDISAFAEAVRKHWGIEN